MKKILSLILSILFCQISFCQYFPDSLIKKNKIKKITIECKYNDSISKKGFQIFNKYGDCMSNFELEGIDTIKHKYIYKYKNNKIFSFTDINLKDQTTNIDYYYNNRDSIVCIAFDDIGSDTIFNVHIYKNDGQLMILKSYYTEHQKMIIDSTYFYYSNNKKLIKMVYFDELFDVDSIIYLRNKDLTETKLKFYKRGLVYKQVNISSIIDRNIKIEKKEILYDSLKVFEVTNYFYSNGLIRNQKFTLYLKDSKYETASNPYDEYDGGHTLLFDDKYGYLKERVFYYETR